MQATRRLLLALLPNFGIGADFVSLGKPMTRIGAALIILFVAVVARAEVKTRYSNDIQR